MKRTRSCYSDGFSLVELLVVIAILVLLAAVLQPVLLRARAQAHVTTCLSHQRQIAAAALLWAGEHGDTLPPAATCWRELALPAKTLRCLAAPRQAYGYVYSARVAGKALGDIPSPERWILTGDGESADHCARTATDFVPRHRGRIVAAYIDGHVALTSPPRDALLVVGTRWGQRDKELLVVGKDGRIQQVLARGSIIAPVYSPDGQHIAYLSMEPKAGLYVMNSDGTDQRQLLDMLWQGLPHGYRDPQWSWDSQTLAFSYQKLPSQGYAIATMGLKDQAPRLLTGANLLCKRPIFTPDGRTIIFSASPADRSIPGTLYRIQTDGTGLQRLPIPRGGMASFSPDGRELVYIARDSTDLNLKKLRVCDADGGEVRTLLTSASGLYCPRFSPDGHTIAFSMTTNVGKLGEAPVITLLDSTTGEMRQLTALNEQYNLPQYDSFCWYPW